MSQKINDREYRLENIGNNLKLDFANMATKFSKLTIPEEYLYPSSLEFEKSIRQIDGTTKQHKYNDSDK